jgi:hypothetical protein
MSSEHGESGTSPEKRKSRKALYGAIAGVAGVVVVAGSIIGIEEATSQPDKRPVATASSDPSHTPEATPTKNPESAGTQRVELPNGQTVEIPTVQSIEIPTGLTQDQLAAALLDRLSKWDMAGATPFNQNAWLASSEAPLDFQSDLAEKNKAIFAEALFGSDWASTPMATYINNESSEGNANSMGLWFDTYESGRDAEAFRDWYDIDTTSENPVRVTGQGTNTITMEIDAIEHEDLNNRAAALSGGTVTPLDGDKFTIRATFESSDGVEKITTFDITDRQ